MTAARIRDLVDVTAAETVVRLDRGPGRLQELVLTGDVRRSVALTLEAAGAACGAAFLLVGHFGSGKSHFLAALGELLQDPRRARELPAWDAGLRTSALDARPSLAVTVPLVDYRSGAGLEDVTWSRAWRALGRDAPPPSDDRSEAWDGLLDRVRGAGWSGLLVLLDELSEFLRSKRGPGLREDLRFLQFLGEWACRQPVVVVAALQESLDETAHVSERELARIRDRYPTRLALSMRHVEDLVRGRLVPLRPGAEAELERIYRSLRAGFPGWGIDLGRFAACYPIHPETLALLDGLRFVLSQQRGVVDFICRQLRGDETAGLTPWLDQAPDRLLTPDRVYGHFETRFRERVETARLAETVVPYYRRALRTLFERKADRDLARRAVELLTLLAASPLERRRDARELAGLLLTRLSALDPSANAAYLERAVLEPLARHGAYVVARPGARATYEVALEADASLTAARLMDQARAEIRWDDRRVIETLLELGASPSVSVHLLRQAGRARRQVIWQQTLRHLLVTAGRLSEWTSGDLDELDAARERAGAELVVFVAEPEAAGGDVAAPAGPRASGRLALWVPDALTPAELEFAVELRCRWTVLQRVVQESPGDGGLVEFLRRLADSDVARAREVLHRCYFQGRLIGPGLRPEPDLDLPALGGQAFDTVLRALAAPLLDALHPRHRDVQPHAEFVGARHVRRLVHTALAGPRLSAAAADREGVRAQVDGWLVPLGALRKRGDTYQVAPDPARSPAVAELLQLVSDGPVPTADLVRSLLEGPVGLTEPESLLLLNGAVQSGIVEARRGRRVVEAPFLTWAEVERFGPGEVLPGELRALIPKLAGVFGPGPHEPWDARMQQASWQHACTWLEGRREDVATVRDGVRRLGESPLHGDVQLGSLPDDLTQLEALLACVDRGATPRLGLEQLLVAVDVPEELLARAARVAGAARFCRADLQEYMAACGYLLDPSLTLPDGELVAEHRSALALAARVLPLAAEDGAGAVLEAYSRFREAFAARYTEEHDRFAELAGPAAVAAVTTSPVYRALCLLAEVAPATVPDDRARVDRALAAGTVTQCRRSLSAELAVRPVCACGFVLGAERPRLDTGALVAVAGRGVVQHLAVLDEPGCRGRLERAAEDLRAVGRAEAAGDVARLLKLCADPDRAEPGTVVHLLEGAARDVLHAVLRGGEVLVQRDLGDLREELAGRRYPKVRLQELLRSWVEGADGLSPHAMVEVADRGAAEAGARPVTSPTLAILQERFPELAAALPRDRAADAFWLAAWWVGRPYPPTWLPGGLLKDAETLERAAEAAARPGAREDLEALDGRVRERTLLGDQVAHALALGDRTGSEVAGTLLGERLLRHPVRLAAGELLRRVAADLALAERVSAEALTRLGTEHVLLSDVEVAPLAAALAAARHLAAAERELPQATPPRLVAAIHPERLAPVPGLLARAATGWAALGASLDGLRALEGAAARVQASGDRALETAALGAEGFPGCLRLWEVGEAVVAPLLRTHGRVAVLLVDAMRADLWLRLRASLPRALPGRRLTERWAVVPPPARTAEAVASLGLGRPVGRGEVEHPGEAPAPFAHLGAAVRVLVGIDRAVPAEDVQELWRDGPELSVGVATGVDRLLHQTPIDVESLVIEAATALERHVLPHLSAVPEAVPLLVLADHGFRENRSWGRGSPDRYAHGGLSLAESVVPVATLEPTAMDPA